MKVFVITSAVLTLLLVPAAANEKKSVYTDLDLGTCRAEPVNPDDPLESGVWWCEGYEGVPVRVGEGDLRFFVSYGENAAEEVAASETLPPFNTIGQKIEWRLDDGVAFATILRWHIDNDVAPSSYLIVTKLGGPGDICQVARIDAAQNPNANALARSVADERAQSFRCGQEEILEY